MLIGNIKSVDSIDKILKKYKKKCEKTKLIKQFINNQYYIKPCIKKREKMLKAKYKQRIIIKKNYLKNLY